MSSAPSPPPDLTRDHAHALDRADPLGAYRSRFAIPTDPTGRSLVYLCGHSLGLMPHAARDAVREELDDWARLGVDGHFEARAPWYAAHETVRETGAHLVGAKVGEVVAMNSLTVNLHLMLASFYRPAGVRTKIAIEANAFPSDRYAVASQVAWHGLDPADTVVELPLGSGASTHEADAIDAWLAEDGDTIALLLLGGVNYYSGQWFDLDRVTARAREAGCTVGLDLAHAVGNVPLTLHDTGPDFAVWCSYKYLNSGPGAVAGCFVHERHGRDRGRLRLAGWWGNDPATRFQMRAARDFVPQPGAEGWQLSNPPILSLAPLRASLEIFAAAGMGALRTKSRQLTGYLATLLDALPTERFTVITPPDPDRRGCQLSLRFGADAADVHTRLRQHGIVTDLRDPDVIRIAPVPLYNTFADVWTVADTLGHVVEAPLSAVAS